MLKLAKAKLELAFSLARNIHTRVIRWLNSRNTAGIHHSRDFTNQWFIKYGFYHNQSSKINALQSKIDMLNVDKKLKANMLLPKLILASI
jgi:hypothetical protein